MDVVNIIENVCKKKERKNKLKSNFWGFLQFSLQNDDYQPPGGTNSLSAIARYLSHIKIDYVP